MLIIFIEQELLKLWDLEIQKKKIPDGSPVEQVLTEGFDKNGYKINFRNFSTDGEGNYPTIDLYNTNGKSKYEIKFEE